MNFRRLAPDALTISLDETTTAADVEAIWSVFAGSTRAPEFAALARDSQLRAAGRRCAGTAPTSPTRC